MSIYLGETPIANTGYDKANTDLSNLTSTGKNIANWSNNVTNCITEIPQDIKLELNNGTLTLKAGSKVYVPNGAGVFDTITTTSDYSTTNTYTGTAFVFYNNNSIFLEDTTLISSGTTPPSNGTFYNTSDNTVKRYANGALILSYTSFPIAIVTCAGAITSIDQVFNGFGYIGSTVFALPGVKGLIPNGRNADGTLKNIEFTIDSVKTATRTWVDSDSRQVWGYIKNPPGGISETWYWNKYIESDEEPSRNDYIMWYKPSENITYVNNGAQSSTPNWEKVNYINFGKASGINSQEIKIFIPKTAFHALDYNDSSTISGWSMPSSRSIPLTLGASGASYTAPANGCFTLGGAGGWFSIYDASTSLTLMQIPKDNLAYPRGFLPARKGAVITIDYSGFTVETFRFIYAEGEN